jgi:alpha-mannosidase
LEVARQFRNSTIRQEIQLDAYNPYITVKNRLDWQEEHILVKVAFPVNWRSPFATYEIPMGAIERSTLAETALEKAKWEVPAQFWADHSSTDIGLSVLNDCKYGYDAKPDQLRLTLLRSPVWCCPDSDRGVHNFTYRLIPHSGSWQQAKIVQRGWELNNSVAIYPGLYSSASDSDQLIDFLNVQDAKGNPCTNIILTALKRSENGNGWILRFYECHGQRTETVIHFLPTITKAIECDLIERAIADVDSHLNYNQHQITLTFKPYAIVTLRVNF